MKFTVEIREYAEGDRPMTTERIESAIQMALDDDASDGIVIVEAADSEAGDA